MLYTKELSPASKVGREQILLITLVHILKFHVGMNPVSCWAEITAHHSHELLSEFLIDQSIHKRIGSGIDHDEYCSGDIRCTSKLVCGNIKGKDVAY